MLVIFDPEITLEAVDRNMLVIFDPEITLEGELTLTSSSQFNKTLEPPRAVRALIEVMGNGSKTLSGTTRRPRPD